MRWGGGGEGWEVTLCFRICILWSMCMGNPFKDYQFTSFHSVGPWTFDKRGKQSKRKGKEFKSNWFFYASRQRSWCIFYIFLMEYANSLRADTCFFTAIIEVFYERVFYYFKQSQWNQSIQSSGYEKQLHTKKRKITRYVQKTKGKRAH